MTKGWRITGDPITMTHWRASRINCAGSVFTLCFVSAIDYIIFGRAERLKRNKSSRSR